jgi:hypothetical protein
MLPEALLADRCDKIVEYETHARDIDLAMRGE